MSRLKASTFSQPLCGIPEDSTARRASHVGARLPRFSARLNARACRGRGRASELVVEVGSPGWARTSDPLINSQVLYRLSYRGTFVSGTAWYPISRRPSSRGGGYEGLASGRRDSKA